MHGDGKDLGHQMRLEQVRDGLVVLEVGRADPDLSQQPVILVISGQEDRVIFARSLLELEEESRDTREGYGIFHPTWCNTCRTCPCTCMAMGTILSLAFL